MTRIEIEEPKPLSVITTHTLLRVVLGGIVLLEAGERALGYPIWQERIAQLQIGDPRLDAPLLARSTLIAATALGLCLCLGLLTRLAALCTLGIVIAVLPGLLVTPGVLFDARFELVCLLIASATYLFVNGAGTLSLDHVLRRRARRRAIERDPIWDSAPYSVPPSSSHNR